MRFPLDFDVLVASGWSNHQDHRKVTSWIASLTAWDRILTSPIPQLGFVRIWVQRASGRITVGEAGEVLAEMLAGMVPDLLANDRCAPAALCRFTRAEFPWW